MAKKFKRITGAKPGPPGQKLVLLSDQVIVAMTQDPRYATEIPCLKAGAKSLRDIPKTCGRCGRKQAKARAEIFRTLRSCILGLPPQQKSKVKSLLNASQVRVLVSSKGGTSRITF